MEMIPSKEEDENCILEDVAFMDLNSLNDQNAIINEPDGGEAWIVMGGRHITFTSRPIAELFAREYQGLEFAKCQRR